MATRSLATDGLNGMSAEMGAGASEMKSFNSKTKSSIIIRTCGISANFTSVIA